MAAVETNECVEEKHSFNSKISSNSPLAVQDNAYLFQSPNLKISSNQSSTFMVLVNGYIHGIQQLLFKQNQLIPTEIYRLIYLFYYQRSKIILFQKRTSYYRKEVGHY